MENTPSERDKARARIQKFAHLLDASIRLPGGIRIGIDSLLGLIPGIGDLFGSLASAWLVLHAVKLGAPKGLIFKMLINIAIDTVIGLVPILGDIFDIFWKANLRNVALLDSYLEHEVEVRTKAAGEDSSIERCRRSINEKETTQAQVSLGSVILFGIFLIMLGVFFGLTGFYLQTGATPYF